MVNLLCIACGAHPSYLRGFCTICHGAMGAGWRAKIFTIKEPSPEVVRRCLMALAMKRASFNEFRTKEQLS